jgi:hypothetical protein
MSVRLLFFISLVSMISSANAQVPLGQTIQVNTHFRSVVNAPEWLLIVRDVRSGQVLPYLFDIRDNDNFWVAFTLGHSYRVTASKLKFGPYAVIHNFCGLEDGIISGESMYVTLRGDLTPNPGSVKCHIIKYPAMPFPAAHD